MQSIIKKKYSNIIGVEESIPGGLYGQNSNQKYITGTSKRNAEDVSVESLNL